MVYHQLLTTTPTPTCRFSRLHSMTTTRYSSYSVVGVVAVAAGGDGGTTVSAVAIAMVIVSQPSVKRVRVVVVVGEGVGRGGGFDVTTTIATAIANRSGKFERITVRRGSSSSGGVVLIDLKPISRPLVHCTATGTHPSISCSSCRGHGR